MLEPLGLGVHLLPRHAELLHQVQLEQPVVAQHLERDRLARAASGTTPWYGSCSTSRRESRLLIIPVTDAVETCRRSASACVVTAPLQVAPIWWIALR